MSRMKPCFKILTVDIHTWGSPESAAKALQDQVNRNIEAGFMLAGSMGACSSGMNGVHTIFFQPMIYWKEKDSVS